MNHTSQSVNIVLAWRLLYCTYGLVPIVAGLDKFCNFLVDWSMYLNGQLPLLLGITPTMFMYAVGIIEIIAGLLLLTKPRLGAYVVCAWLVGIALNLINMKYYDIAVRDIGLAIGAYVLVLLSKELNK